MKTLSKFKIIIAIIAFTSLTLSCTDEVPTLNTAVNNVDMSTMGILKGNPIFSQLVTAIELSELTATLKSAEPFTVFAPANDAFDAFLKTTPYKTVNEVPKEVLKQIVLNHVLKGQILASDFKTGYTKTLATSPASGTNNISMYIDITSGILINGVSKVVSTNNTRPSNFIHVVDKVISLPTVITHAQANQNFTSLVDNLKKTVEPNLVTALSGVGPFTVFAPTNAAFTAFSTELGPTGLNGVSIANLTKVLQYHVANGNVLASSLQEGQPVKTLELPQEFVIQLAGGAKIKDASNRTINITATDVQCANGVIHVLDRVLRPKL